jgi:MtrB/PioB family decaheme-associated outer membrane protein
MRIPRLVLIVALVLAPAAGRAQSSTPSQPGAGASQPSAGQQTPPAKPSASQKPAQEPAAEEEELPVFENMIDVGARATSLDGDAARYERYRDLGDGLFLENVRLARERNGLLFDFAAEHVGRRDQRYVGGLVKPGKLKASFMWDQIPMLLSGDTRTFYSGIGTGTLSTEDSIQAQGQASPGALTDIFKQSALQFETRTRRHIADGRFQYEATEALTFSTSFRRTNRSGTIPFGGSFGHNSLAELPAPTEHNLSEFEAGAEYVRNPLLLRAGYSGSWFHNDVTSVIFDNPFRLTDIASASSRGRLTLQPSNSFIGVNGLVSVKLPYRSRATGYVSVGMLKDAGDSIVPQTINSVVSPLVAPLERSTVEGEARTSAVNLNFVSRPKQYLDLTVRYRSYDYDNKTPELTLTQRVSYDNAISAATFVTEPFGVLRHTFDADVRLIPRGRMSAGVGYSRIAEERTHRIFESTTDNQFRLTFDAMSRQWFSLRTKYEHAQRRGDGIEEGELELEAILEQPKLRHFDIASRDRDRFTVIGTVTPNQYLSANASIGAGKDDYIESIFGLRDNTHKVYGIGADLVPHDRMNFGLSYSYEDYDALQRSRQAGGPTGSTANERFDPSRNWAADTSDHTHSLLLNAEVTRIADKVDLRFMYDFSRARARYDYITGAVPNRTLPEEVVIPSTLTTPTELPPTLSELNRGTLDVAYALSRQLSLGVSYWYERYRVTDFALDVDANPDLVRGQALLLGYLYRPYTANTGWVRLIYRW